MPAQLMNLLTGIKHNRRIDEADVIAIRRIIYPDGAIMLPEAEALFALNTAAKVQDPAWHSLFVEALTDYVVYQAEPRGFVSADNMHWLFGQIQQDGEVIPDTELALLLNVLEKSISAPNELAVFTLNEVKSLILRQNRISEREVNLLRKVLYAAGGQQNIAITREEAEVVYAIHDAFSTGDPDPAWTDLFVKVLLNHLMFASGFEPPAREEALRHEKWLDDTSVSPSRFLSSMTKSLPSLLRLYRPPVDVAHSPRLNTAIQNMAEHITDDEAQWLASRMLQDGRLSETERALVTALRAEHPQLHPVIEDAIGRLA